MNLQRRFARAVDGEALHRPERLVVVYDELDLAGRRCGSSRKGSAAGHKGMKSVIASLNTARSVRCG